MASIIEEGKINLTVSLLVEVEESIEGIIEKQNNELCTKLNHLLMQLRIAGGNVKKIAAVQLYDHGKETKKIIAARLTPAFVLKDAQEELAIILKELQTGIRHENKIIRGRVRAVIPESKTGLPKKENATALDVLLAMTESFSLPPQEQAEESEWKSYSFKSGRGWLVPIAIGYQGISPKYEIGTVSGLRAPQYPSQFVETIYSLGKWEFALTLKNSWEKSFWHYQAPQDNLYLFKTKPQEE